MCHESKDVVVIVNNKPITWMGVSGATLSLADRIFVNHMHGDATAGLTTRTLQVASPLVYRLAKHVVLNNVRQEGTEINRRFYARSIYGDIQAKIANYLDLQPQSECLTI